MYVRGLGWYPAMYHDHGIYLETEMLQTYSDESQVVRPRNVDAVLKVPLAEQIKSIIYHTVR